MGGRDRSGLALAALALATLGVALLPWTRYCNSGNCFTATAWASMLGSAVAAIAAGLLVCELLPVLGLGHDRAFLGGLLGLGLAATIVLLVAFELTDISGYGIGAVWYGSWLGLALAVVLLVAGGARLRGHVREVPLKHEVAVPVDLLFLGGAVVAFASTFVRWISSNVDWHHAGAWTLAGHVGLGFGLLALALIGCEALRLAGVRPARDETLSPVTVVLAGLTAIFGVSSVVVVQRDVSAATLGRGTWLALAASAALIAGAVLRLRKI